MSCSKTTVKKAKTGIQGLDEITGGGIPAGRPTLVCGGPGCGKTLLAMEFLVRGATEYGEPGVFMAFEESMAELCANVASVGFDLSHLLAEKRLFVDEVMIDPEQTAATGDFDLDGLFLRLADAIARVGARRVAFDTLERLFSSLPDPGILRAELHRLFRWLKERDITVILTAERGDGALTRHGLEEYVSDCVIVLSHELNNLISTRRLRVMKYRGSSHGTNDYPFLIDDDGISILPVTSVTLAHEASRERISSGVERLDEMLGGQGFFRGSSILLSGTAGTGKTSLSGHFTSAACERGERVLYFAFEESASQIQRNLESIGIDLSPCMAQGQLQIHATRPSFTGLEMHLALMHKAITSFAPQIVILDPLNSFLESTEYKQLLEVKAMLMRMLDYLKLEGITGFFTSLTTGGEAAERTDVAISSLIDTWIALTATDVDGYRIRRLDIIKSRGMAHSSESRPFSLTGHGVDLLEPHTGHPGHPASSEPAAQHELALRHALMQARISTLQAEYALQAARIQQQITPDAISGSARDQARDADSLGSQLAQHGGSR
ncbi:circadian clock protein KaiC [Thiorhodovibrio frisius]|uniref:non-specific serine/threonine protein kinase n=1 Tax=Thiorhodovibrio frisius TaxID=631362 RepID=H8Z3C3_9GAMM|nr:circadian clock protein KaiC [Thiorhodovibrio frisius]EIC21831.1 RecA-superfamily ATPase possibly involved in signal transduction [Thiorhodovibrio frisius]WPL21799.1 Circadian clock protein kinase KaiC [Thiorhodovibrio frisius]